MQVKLATFFTCISCLLTTNSKTEALSEKMPSLWVLSDGSQNHIKVLNTQWQMHLSTSIQLGTKKSILCQLWDKPWQLGRPERRRPSGQNPRQAPLTERMKQANTGESAQGTIKHRKMCWNSTIKVGCHSRQPRTWEHQAPTLTPVPLSTRGQRSLPQHHRVSSSSNRNSHSPKKPRRKKREGTEIFRKA